MGPLALAGVGAGMNFVNRLLHKPKTGILDPQQYQNLLRYSPMDMAGMRNNAMGNVHTANRGNIAAIRQGAAANRLPVGAMLSALGGSSYNAARGAASIEPQMTQMRKGADMNYYNLLDRYSQGQAQEQNEYTDMMSGEIGNFTNLGMNAMNMQNANNEISKLGLLSKIGMLLNVGITPWG